MALWVNLENIYNALQWLSLNNKFYANIKFTPEEIFNKYTSIRFDPKDENEPNVEIETKNIKGLRQFTVIDLSKININTSDINKYNCKKVNTVPLANRDTNLDHLCFPDIFPYGRGGMYDVRPYKISEAMFNRWAIWNSNPAPRRNQQYIFSMIHNKEMRAVESGIYASLQSTKCSNLNAKALLEKLDSNDCELNTNLLTTMGAVRNSDEYWAKVSRKLKATNEHFGPATFFGTLSSAEYNWIDMKCFLKTMNKDLPNINDLTLDDLIEIDPCSVCIFWDKKFHAFWKNFVSNPIGPFGEVYAEFKRREYQARGLQHIHFKLWVKDAPIFGKNTNLEVITFIDKYITCRLPDPIKEPKLYELVMKYQRHKCCSSCLQAVYRNGHWIKQCRHGFPKKVQPETTLNSVDSCLKSRIKGKRITKLYNLKRRPGEEYINDYNEQMILAWEFYKQKKNDGQRIKKRSTKKTKISETAGLETTLRLGINSRVMLRRNTDVSKGLVNGALGTVTEFHKLANGQIAKIKVKFDNLNEDVFVDRIIADYESHKDVYVTRSQFPLTLAWAITIHKCQGLTLDNVMIDLGDDIFEPGMAYVAISRARKLDNIFI